MTPSERDLSSELAGRIGHRLRTLREWRGLSQYAMAERLGSYAAAVSATESGRKLQRLDTLTRYAMALGVPLSEVLCVVGDLGAIREAS